MNAHGPLPAEDLEFIGREGASLWPDLKGVRIFITGATGFFGRWLLESLLWANERRDLGVSLVALSRNPEAFLGTAPHLAVSGLGWMTGSIADLRTEAFEGERFDMVIHLATESDMQGTHANPRAAVGVITNGTKRALDVAARTGARRFLFTSSGAVYGPQPREMERIAESYPGIPDPLDREWPYSVAGEAKRQAENLCVKHARANGLEAVIARCFTFAGPCLPTEAKFAFGNFMKDALRGGPILIKGDGATVRSYLYPADLSVWLWTLLLRGAPGRAYNVGSESAVSLRHLAEAMAAELDSKGPEVQQDSEPVSRSGRYVPSTQRAREELGLKENFSLPDIIRRTAAWHRAEVKH
jgi:nucleoside-diphosphate-sugar epimerase